MAMLLIVSALLLLQGSAEAFGAAGCERTLENLCGPAQKQGKAACDSCLKAEWPQITKANCSLAAAEGFCSGTPPPPAPPAPPGPAAGYLCYYGTCYQKSSGTLTKAQCESTCSAAPPGPPPGGDTWETYTVAGMQVQSVVGGLNGSNYDKVIIMLHGGGETGGMWPGYYTAGWFGPPGQGLNGLKYVFPTSPDHVWYQSFKKEGCGLLNDCAYNLSSIAYKSSLVRALLDQEMLKVGGDGKNVYLAGFSEGAQMAGYMQLVDLPFALGGVVVMDGFPLPPLENMPGAPQSAARANASYFADDMKWIIYEGSEDYIFPPKLTLDTWGGIFSALGCESTLTTKVIQGMGHTVVQDEITALVALVRNGTVPARK